MMLLSRVLRRLIVLLRRWLSRLAAWWIPSRSLAFRLLSALIRRQGCSHSLARAAELLSSTSLGVAGLRGQIPVVLEAGGVSLPLVASYRHLGTQQCPNGALKPELRYRIAQARASFSEGRRKVYKVTSISVRRKAHILGATALAKLFHGAGSWGPLSKGETRMLTGAVWGLYRPLLGLGRDDDQHVDAYSCLALLDLPSPAVWLRFHRLLYLGQLVTSGPPALWSVLRADRAHASLLLADLLWLHSWTWSTIDLPNPAHDWPAWLAFIQAHPKRYKGLVKRARALEGRRNEVVAALNCLHRSLLRLWDAIGSHGIRTDVSAGLLAALLSADPSEEGLIWNTVAEYVEPLAVLRATVEEWKASNPSCATIAETADNVLLLLDVDLIADSQQPPPAGRVPFSEEAPAWAVPGGVALVCGLPRRTLSLAAPPGSVLSPWSPTSMRLRDAAAYSSWIEAACTACARLLESSRCHPGCFLCPGVAAALGPAADWMRAAGFEVWADGVATPA